MCISCVVTGEMPVLCTSSHGSCKHSSEVQTSEAKEEKGRLVGMRGMGEGKGYVSIIRICNVCV